MRPANPSLCATPHPPPEASDGPSLRPLGRTGLFGYDDPKHEVGQQA